MGLFVPVQTLQVKNDVLGPLKIFVDYSLPDEKTNGTIILLYDKLSLISKVIFQCNGSKWRTILWCIYSLTSKETTFEFGHFTTISGHFFVNCMNIFHRAEISTVILRCLTHLNINWIKSNYIKHTFFHFWFFCKLTELTKTDEYMKPYFSAFSWIVWGRIIRP